MDWATHRGMLQVITKWKHQLRSEYFFCFVFKKCLIPRESDLIHNQVPKILVYCSGNLNIFFCHHRRKRFSGDCSCINFKAKLYSIMLAVACIFRKMSDLLKRSCSTSETGSLSRLVFNSGQKSAGKNPIKSKRSNAKNQE